MKIRENFLPIPGSPNYEVNSQFWVRNKKTGRILKTSRGKVFFRDGNKAVSRLTVTLRNQAVAAAKGGNWTPVPSLGNLYELNSKGDLRNFATKKKLIYLGNRQYSVKINGKSKTVYKPNLLWEVFGIIPKRRKNTAIPNTIEKCGQKLCFENLKLTANFLATKIFYSSSIIAHWLHQRKTEIDGWKITYHLPKDLTDVTDTVGDWAKVKRTKNVNWLKIGVLTTIPAAKKASD